MEWKDQKNPLLGYRVYFVPFSSPEFLTGLLMESGAFQEGQNEIVSVFNLSALDSPCDIYYYTNTETNLYFEELKVFYTKYLNLTGEAISIISDFCAVERCTTWSGFFKCNNVTRGDSAICEFHTQDGVVGSTIIGTEIIAQKDPKKGKKIACEATCCVM